MPNTAQHLPTPTESQMATLMDEVKPKVLGKVLDTWKDSEHKEDWLGMLWQSVLCQSRARP